MMAEFLVKVPFFLTSIVTFICFSGAATLAYPQSKSILQRADQYSVALRKFESGRKRASVEGIIRKGRSVAEKYDELESLTDAEYAALEKKMKGYVINREEVLIIDPDLKFFSDLSRRKGTTADVAFFNLLRGQTGQRLGGISRAANRLFRLHDIRKRILPKVIRKGLWI